MTTKRVQFALNHHLRGHSQTKFTSRGEGSWKVNFTYEALLSKPEGWNG